MVFWFIVYGLLFMEDGGEIRGERKEDHSTTLLLNYSTIILITYN